jgi:hypothetical protein
MVDCRRCSIRGPRELVEAGFREATVAISADCGLWVRRGRETTNVDFSFTGSDMIDFVVSHSDEPPEQIRFGPVA